MSEKNLGVSVDVFLVVGIEEVCYTVVRNLDLVVVLKQDVASGQVPVDHAVLLQVVHTLRQKTCILYIPYMTHVCIQNTQNKSVAHTALTLAICTHQLSRRWGSMLFL